VTDLYVRYIAADQRGYIRPEIQAALDAMTPLFEVTLSGIPYAQVYDIRELPIPEYLYHGITPTSVWNGSVHLVVANIPGRTQPLKAGTRHEWTVFLRDLPDSTGAPERLGLRLQLLDLEGNQILRSDGPLLRQESKHGLWVERRTVTIPWGTPAGTYRVVGSIYDLETGIPVSGLDYQYGIEVGPTVQLGCLGVGTGVRVRGTGC
jgi:hypothetical protein